MDGALSASFSASRLVGVAPLAVFFDATATSATALTAQPFHELHYDWDFGDPADGATWSTSGTSKNSAQGPLAAHVFERAGTYTISLSVRHGGQRSTATQTITVRDPSAFYTGALTYCLANGPAPDWTGCPAGATRIADSRDFGAAIQAHLRSQRRLLFRRGDTWTSSSPAVLEVNGPWTIGAFGEGPKPIVRYAAGQSLLQLGVPAASRSDARVMDLELDGASSPRSECLGARGTFDNVLLLRIDCHDVGHGIRLDALNVRPVSVWKGVAIVDTHVANLTGRGGNCYYVTGENFAVLGSSGRDSVSMAEHIFRSMYLYKAVLADNIFARPNATKHSLALRAPDWSTTYGGTIPANTYTRLVVIGGNKLVGGRGVGSELEIATSDGNDERVRDIIVERNWWVAGEGGFAAAWVNTSYSSYRNNLFDMTGSGQRWQHCLLFDRVPAGRPRPTSNWIYNNTCYSAAHATAFTGVFVTADAVDTVVRNNLGFAPNAKRASLLVDEGTNSQHSNNTLDPKIDPQFIANPPMKPADFRPARGYALGAGANVPVWADYFNISPARGRDIGAVNY